MRHLQEIELFNKRVVFRMEIAIGLLVGIVLSFYSGFLFIALLFSAALYCILRIKDKREKKFILMIFISGVFLRISLILPTHFLATANIIGLKLSFKETGGALFGDDAYLHLCAKQAALYLRGQSNSLTGVLNPSYGWHGFTYFMGILYAFFGNSPLLGKLFNSIISTLTGTVAYYIAKDGFNNISAGKLSGVIVVFWPTLILWSIVNLKDSLFIFLILLFMLIAIQKKDNKIFSKISLFLIPIVFFIEIVGFNFGKLMFSIIIMYYLVMWFYAKGKKAIGIFLSIFAVGVFFCVMTKINLIGLIKSGFWNAIWGLAIRQRGAVSCGGGSYKIYPYFLYDYNKTFASFKELSYLGVLISYAKGVINFSFQPFLWRFDTMANFILFPQMVVWCFAIFITLQGVFLSFLIKNRNIFILIFYLLAFISIAGLSEGNIGTVVRHRDAITPVIIILASIAICRNDR